MGVPTPSIWKTSTCLTLPSLALTRPRSGAHGLVRASFVPPEPIRQLRDLTRARTVITGSEPGGPAVGEARPWAPAGLGGASHPSPP